VGEPVSLLAERDDPGPTIKLPPPQPKGRLSVEEAIAKRRSVRTYAAEPLTLVQAGQLLWAAQGMTGPRQSRAAPSAGATYPLEILAAVGRETVGALQAAVYHYEVSRHALTLHLSGDLREDLASAALDQGFIASAPMDIVICTLYHRTTYRYGRRGERYVHMEVGHVAENVHLQAVASGLAAVEVGAFDDEEVRKVLRLDEQIKPLCIMPIGKPR